VAPGRYSPDGAHFLFQAPATPPSWYRLNGNPTSSAPGTYTFSPKEIEEQVINTGQTLSIISDLDWVASGATSLLNSMIAQLPIADKRPYTLLQRYMLEVGRGIEKASLLQTGRYANQLWHIRDSYLNKIHPSIPRDARQVLRNTPLKQHHLFLEEGVSSTAETLKSDLQFTSLQGRAPVFNRSQGGKRGPSTSQRSRGAKKPRPQQTQTQNNQSGSARGWNPSNRGNRGRGRGGRGRGRGKPS